MLRPRSSKRSACIDPSRDFVRVLLAQGSKSHRHSRLAVVAVDPPHKKALNAFTGNEQNAADTALFNRGYGMQSKPTGSILRAMANRALRFEDRRDVASEI